MPDSPEPRSPELILVRSPEKVSRQFDDHRGSLSFPLALRKRAPTMLLGDGANDEQTQARALHCAPASDCETR